MHAASKNDKLAMQRKLGRFLQQYRRRAQRGPEPNDRGYDRGIENFLRKLNPEDLDVLLNGEGDDRLPQYLKA